MGSARIVPSLVSVQFNTEKSDFRTQSVDQCRKKIHEKTVVKVSSKYMLIEKGHQKCYALQPGLLPVLVLLSLFAS